MAKEPSAIERPICYVIDKIFSLIMLLLYGARPSETKAQKLTRWMLLVLVIAGLIAFLSVVKTIFR